MAEPIQNIIVRSLQSARSLYYRLVLLVGKSGSGKTSVLRDVAEELDAPFININLELSERLLELTAKQRILRLPGILDQITQTGYSTVVLDNLEIFFDKELKQDPLRLLQGISRNRSVVASWNGSIVRGKLTYAETGHPEYLCYDLIDTLIVGMDGVATVDSASKTTEAG